jgi:hypothetical protein
MLNYIVHILEADVAEMPVKVELQTLASEALSEHLL